MSFFPFLASMVGHSGKSGRVDVASAETADTRVVLWYRQQLCLIIQAQKFPLGDLDFLKRKEVPTKDIGHHNLTKVLRTRTCLSVFV